MKDIVAVQNGLSPEVLKKAGGFTLWELSGSIDFQKLAAAWFDDGLEPALLPQAPTPATALHRATKDQTHGRRSRVECLADGGWAILRKRDTQDDEGADVQTDTDLRVWLNEDESLRFAPEDDVRTGIIEEDYYRHQQELSPIDVSGWLTSQMRRLNAVPLRSRGGTYYMPPTSMPEWRRIVAVVRGCSRHKLYAVPAFENDADTVELIVDSISAEAESLIAKVAEETADEGKRGGERRLKTRKDKLTALEEKLGTYEKLLGRSLDAVRDRLDEVDDEVSIALIAAAAEKDKKAKAKVEGKAA